MYYGWIIVATAFIAQYFVIGFFTYGFPFFVLPLENEFGATRVEVMYGITWATALGLIVAPLVGMLVDKWSIRWLMSIGGAALGIGLITMSRSESILQFSLLFAGVLCIANNLLGPLTCATVVARWFSLNRGKALGIMAIGTSVGGMTVPFIMESGISNIGWRDTLVYYGIAVLIILLPFTLLAIRNFPHDKGLEVEGGKSIESLNRDSTSENSDTGISPAGEHSVDDEMSMTQIIRTPAYWLIGGTLGLLFMSQVGVLANLGAYAEGLGLSGGQTGRLIFIIACMGFIGKLLFGFAADKISLKLGLWVAILLAATGVSILSLEPSYSVMLVAAVCLGLAAGGMLPVWGAMIAAAFGIKSYGRAMGAMMPLIALLVMPGPIVAAKLFDLSGSYTNSFYLFVGVLALAFVLLIPLKLKPALPFSSETRSVSQA